MKNYFFVSLVIFGLTLQGILPARAEVKLPAVIGSHMVLQRDQPVPIWGWADAGEKVTVTCGNQKKTSEPGADGRWTVKLDPMPAGGPHVIVIEGKNKIQLEDVLVGEVWLCAGQSNMGSSVIKTLNGSNEVLQANFPQIRLFAVPKTFSAEPQTDCLAKWAACTPDTARNFTAVGFYFGKEIHKKLNIPVGLTFSAWSGTSAEAWINKAGLEADPAVGASVKRDGQKYVEAYPERKKKSDEAMIKWEVEARKAKENNQPSPKKPDVPLEPGKNYNAPTVLFNAMINPIAPFGIRGVLWYQGEGNIDHGYTYRKLFPALIGGWRKQWGQGDFPFLFVQIGGWRDVPVEPKESAFSDLRESQLVTWQTVANTFMAVTLDICEGKVHFRNKPELGHRLALAARALVYGEKGLVYSGPLYKSMTVEGNKIKITFDHVGGGLVTNDGQPVKSLAIAGEDKKFVWADSKIENHMLVVWSPKVEKPSAVRYAWGEWPAVNLANKEGLPASPFRTDDWPGPTQHKWKDYTK